LGSYTKIYRFLQAKCHIRLISSRKNIKAIREALDCLPDALNETYEGVLLAIKKRHPDDLNLLQNTLRWLCQSNYCLPLDEFPAIIAVDKKDTQVDLEAIAFDSEDLCKMLSCLILIDRRVKPAELALAHPTIEAYLHSPEILTSAVRIFSVDREEAQRRCAETCMQYCSFTDFAQPLTNRSKNWNPFKCFPAGLGIPFHTINGDAEAMEARLSVYKGLYYTSHNWPEHLRRAQYSQEEFKLHVKPVLEWFLHGDSNEGQYRSWQEVHAYYCSSRTCDCGFWQPPFYFSIVFGLENCFEDLLPAHQAALNSQFDGGSTPLTVALRNGHLGIARRLLESGATSSVEEEGLRQRLERCPDNGQVPANQATDTSSDTKKREDEQGNCRERLTCRRCLTVFSVSTGTQTRVAHLTPFAAGLNAGAIYPVCSDCNAGWSLQGGYNIRTDTDTAGSTAARNYQ
jgi:hypothetical protein